MATIALFGDSTFETSYLLASFNPALQANWGKAAGYDGRLHTVLASALAARGCTATVTNYAVSGMDSSEALSTSFANPSRWSVCRDSNPNVVVFGFGANDDTAGLTKAQYKANIETMVADCIANGIAPVLTTYLWVDFDGGHFTYDRNAEAALGKYADAMIELAEEYRCTLIDTRLALRQRIEAGEWDIYSANDSTYFADFENGSTPGTAAYYANIHPWINGIIYNASTIATRLLECEPLLGGKDVAGRTTGWRTGGALPTGFAAITGLVARWQVNSAGKFTDRLSNLLSDNALTASAYSGGRGYGVSPSGTPQVNVSTKGLLPSAGTIIFFGAADWPSTTGTPYLMQMLGTAGNANRIYFRKASSAARRVEVAMYGADAAAVVHPATSTTATANLPTICGFRWYGTTFSAFVHEAFGSEQVTDAMTALAATAEIGSALGANAWGNPMSGFLFYDRRLSNTEIDTIRATLASGLSRTVEEAMSEMHEAWSRTPGYTQPDNVSIAAIKTSTDAIPAASTIATATRSELATELARLDAAISTRAASTGIAATTMPQSGTLTVTRGTDATLTFTGGDDGTLTLTAPGATSAALTKTLTAGVVTLTDAETTALPSGTYRYAVRVTEGTTTTLTHSGVAVVV